MTDRSLSDLTRRAVLKATAGALGAGAAGTASAHEKWDSDGGSATAGQVGDDVPGNTVGADVVGYHSLGAEGGEGRAGRPSKPHYGTITDVRSRGDYAYVTIISSERPTPNRGMAVVDISGYNKAATAAQADASSMSVVSFLRNQNSGGAMMDPSISDDGEYVFIGTQPTPALYFEVFDPEKYAPNVQDESATSNPAGVIAVDVSDKGNPRTVGYAEVGGAVGVHNLHHHRIGDEEYVFAVSDINGGTEGLYVYRFDRTSGGFEFVNLWTYAGDTSQGEPKTGNPYMHDVEVQNDPVTGNPTLYLSYWDQGMVVLDASTPADFERLGTFEMSASHFSSPAPRLYEFGDGRRKRLAISSQEIGSSDSSSGDIYLVDTSGIYEEDAAVLDVPDDVTPGGRPVELDNVGRWEWFCEGDGCDHAKKNPDEGFSFSGFNLSPHNSDFAVDADGDFWVHQSHYNGGLRYLKVEETADGLDLTETGFSRPVYDQIPEDSMGTGLKVDDTSVGGISDAQPYCWGAVQSNGVTLLADLNQGLHAVVGDGVSVGGGPAFATVTRSDDASLFTGGQTDRVDLELTTLRRYDEVRVRDRLPTRWDVVDGDAYESYEEGGTTYVEFTGPVGEGETLSYFADVGGDTDGATVGPVEVSTDGGDTWRALAGTIETNVVVGASTNLLFGTAAATAGMAAYQRDRLADRARDLLDRED